MRFLTAGESHGQAMIAILEGFPKGIKIEASYINEELKRRWGGFGRGKRMHIEQDCVEILSGLRNKITLGSPICMLVRNKDAKIFTQTEDNLPPLFVPRPGHSDFGGCLKYEEKDIRNILERASARETVTRVCVGAACKIFLSNFNIVLVSFIVRIGNIMIHKKPKNIEEIIKKTKESKLNCIDRAKEILMINEIEGAQREGDTLGGILEVWAQGLPPGLGSCMHFDKRLDAKIAAYLMSIPSVKAVEIGAGFEYARKRGSESHDKIYFSKRQGFYRRGNNSGGIEGGISNGEPIVIRIGAKPIPTLKRPLYSVNLVSKRRQKATVQRSDVCIIGSLGVIAESMVAIALVESFLEKFGSDSLKEVKRNYRNYLRSLP